MVILLPLVFGLLAAGCARKCCTTLQLTDGWLMRETKYPSGSRSAAKEERFLQKDKLMICPRMVTCYKI